MGGASVIEKHSQLQIAGWRNYRNMTQRELAARSGLAVTTINEIETGKRCPRPSTLRRLAAALGTEDWNLYNHAGDIYGSVPEAAQAIERLARVSSVFSQSGGGAALAAEVTGMGGDMGIDVSDVVASAEEAMLLLIPFWIKSRAFLTAKMPPKEAHDDARLLADVVPYRVREWVDNDIPREAAEALLRAEAQAVSRVAEMLSGDATGDNDAIA